MVNLQPHSARGKVSFGSLISLLPIFFELLEPLFYRPSGQSNRSNYPPAIVNPLPTVCEERTKFNHAGRQSRSSGAPKKNHYQSTRSTAWAKLLDYLAAKYALLFIVSAGNIKETFQLDAYKSVDEFKKADTIERQVVVLSSLEASKGVRPILSPAEAINVLTVGALHSDGGKEGPKGFVDPFHPTGVPNLCSAAGLGINRGIKPDLLAAGGRQFASSEATKSIVSVWGVEHEDAGQLAAAPDIFGGDITKVIRSTGTSNSAALVTRA